MAETDTDWCTKASQPTAWAMKRLTLLRDTSMLAVSPCAELNGMSAASS
jgi:hypothetical protein